MSTIKIGSIQMECSSGEWEHNLKHSENYLMQCSAEGVSLALLPELFNTGYLMDYSLAKVAEESYDKTVNKLSSLSKSLNMFIVAGIPVPQKEEKPLNGILLFTPGGNVQISGKLHLCQMMYKETDYLSAAKTPLVFELNGTKIGALICYDIAFPEAARMLALEGAEIILVSAAWNITERSHVYEFFTKARALENGVWLVASNQTGGPSHDPFLGCSRFVTPKGNIMAEMKREQGILVQNVDLSLSQKLLDRGETYPFLGDRKPNLYGNLC